MNKKNIIYTIIVIALITLIVGFSFYIFDSVEDSKQTVNPGDPKKENTTAYIVKLIDSEGFTLRSETYNDSNNVNVYIKSQNKHSTLNIESIFYDSNGSIVEEHQQWEAFLNGGDEILCNFSLEPSIVKSIVIKVTANDSNNHITFQDKNKIEFESEPIANHEGAIKLKTTTPFDSPINWVFGYVLFYRADEIIDVEPFLIENVEKDNEISTTVEAKNNKKYDFIKVYINSFE